MTHSAPLNPVGEQHDTSLVQISDQIRTNALNSILIAFWFIDFEIF